VTTYKDCKVGVIQQMIMESDEVGVGYGFSILSADNQPLCALAFGTREDAEQARVEVARAVEKAVEVTPQG
jgi:hypothetical protein